MENNQDFFNQLKEVQQEQKIINNQSTFDPISENSNLEPKVETKKEEIIKPVENIADSVFDIKEAIESISSAFNIENMSVTLPAIKTDVIVEPLKYESEIKIATTRLNTYDFAKHINSIILKYTKVNDPIIYKKYFSSIENFENNILITDRSILLFSLLMISFEKLAEVPMQCSKCNKEYVTDIDTKNLNINYEVNVLDVDYYNFKTTQSLLNGLIEIDLGINPEWIRLELLKNQSEEDTKENIEKNESLFSMLDQYLLYIKEIRVYQKSEKNKNKKLHKKFVATNKETFNILRQFLHELPLKVKEIINDQINLDEINKIIPVFETMFVCPYCRNVDKLPFNPEIEFFRKALSLSV